MSRRITILVGLAVLLAAVAGLSLALGSIDVPWSSVWRALVDHDPTDYDQLVVRDQRLPRTLVGLAAGGALGVAGAIAQGLTRNPLASPDLLGINAGASFAVVGAITWFGVTTTSGYVGFALLGATAGAAIVLGVGASGRAGPTPVKLALAGAVISALLGAWTTTLLVLDHRSLDQVRFWQVGALADRDLDAFLVTGPLLLAGLVLSAAVASALDVLALGDDVATSLGQRTARVRVAAALAVILLGGTAVALAGPLAFVGLAVPHLARGLSGPNQRWCAAYSLLLGPILLLGADIIGRIVLRPAELEVGIITALVGAPFLVHYARRRRLTPA